ncbi:MAG: 3-oxoadipyl-CoA thiolase, partial [Betaproteobacteria bacterium RIFCSPLOWO2_12_FULL_65_14]
MSEAFICDAIRTPIGRYGGALASIRTDDLGAIPLKTLMERNQGVDWGALEDVYYGCVNQAGEDNRNVARMALLLAGLPKEVPGATVNRLCGSSMEAVGSAARAIQTGQTELMIAGGVESMTRAPFVINKADSAFSRSARIEDTTIGWRFVNPKMKAQHGIDAMADTAENLADEHKIARGDQDAFALRSQQRWARAQAGGFFKSEVIAVTIAGKKGTSTVVDKDEHPRPETTLEALTKLKPVTRENGTVTAGNASGVNDGAGAMIIASEAAAKKHGLVPKARILAMATAGVAPRIMGIGPVPATRKVLARTGLTLKQMEVIELNEAFAAQSLAVTRELGIADDAAHMNPNGGA